MFRSALSPQRQTVLDEQPQPQPQPPAPSPSPSPPRRATASSFRSFFFGKDETQPDPHHDVEKTDDRPHEGATTKASPYPSKKPTPDVVVAPPRPNKTNRRDTFQRANSHPIRLDASVAHSGKRAFDPSMTSAAALDSGGFQPSPQRGTTPRQQYQSQRHSPKRVQTAEPPSLRSTVYGSCSHALSTVISVLVQMIKTHNEYPHSDASTTIAVDGSSPPLDCTTVRKTKLLYIALLEKVQKERGEWQGFGADEHTKDTTTNGDDVKDASLPHDDSANGLLTASLNGMTKAEAFVILNELLELSFRNLRVSIVSPSVYSKHRRDLAAQLLSCPASLAMLLRIGAFVRDMSRDEKRCLLHLVNFWYAACAVSPYNQELKRIVEEKHMLVLSESSEMEFMQQVARRSIGSDPVAVDVLTVMAHYRELIFCDLEFYTIRQEMHIPLKFPEPPQKAVRSVSQGTETEMHSHELGVSQDVIVSPPKKEVSADGTFPEQPTAEEPTIRQDQINEALNTLISDDDDESTTPQVAPLAAEDFDLVETAPSHVSEPVSSSENERRSPSAVTAPLPRTPPSSPASPENDTTKSSQQRLASRPSSATKTAAKIKSPIVSPHIKRSRHYHIHAAPPAAAKVAALKRRPSVRVDPVVDATLPHVVVALTAASLGVLATVAFFALRRTNTNY